MIKIFAIFVFLQLVDFGTTAAALLLGGAEQNPLVQHLMGAGALQGLAMAKGCALVIGTGCWLANKYNALRLANMAFAVIAVWNASIVARLMF